MVAEIDVEQTASPARHPRQFALGELFRLTSLVALALLLALRCRDSQSFRGLYSIWTLAALVLLSTVWLVDRMRLLSSRTLARGSMLLFLFAVLLPIPDGSGDVEVGGLGLLWISLASVPQALGWITGAARMDLFELAALVGCIANVAFLAGYGALVFGARRARVAASVRWLALLSLVAAVAALPMMVYSFESIGGILFHGPVDPYPTYGLWVASPWALWLGTRHGTSDAHVNPPRD